MSFLAIMLVMIPLTALCHKTNIAEEVILNVINVSFRKIVL